jgi:glutamate synthase domain-containing protein 2
LINLMHAWRERMVEIMVRLGVSSVKDLRGRSNLLTYSQEEEAL